MNYDYVIFFLPSRTQSEPSGHVWREVQTLQGNQVHDQSWEVPSSNLKGEFCEGNSHEHFFLSYLSKSKKYHCLLGQAPSGPTHSLFSLAFSAWD